MDAYDIARALSEQRTNPERARFIETLAKSIADELGYKLVKQKIRVEPKYGNQNFILDSGSVNPLLITAHYDASLVEKSTGLTTPGANDNGSGVGAVLQVARSLKELPVDIALFGAEEHGLRGAKHYISKMRKKPIAVVNMDSCGSGGKLGILIPKEVYVDSKLTQLGQIDPKLNSYFLDSAKRFGFQVCTEDPFAAGDHCAFMKIGVPATTLQGEDHEFFGIENGNCIHEKMIMHTEKDTIETVDREFLNRIVKVLINGSRRLLKES